MLWSAGIDAPRHVWVHGFLTVARREDEQEPRQLPRPGGHGRRVRRRRDALRDAPRGPVRPRRRRVLGLVRPPLQRRPRQRLRQPRSTGRSRWSTGTSAASARRRARPATSPLAEGWADTLRPLRRAPRGLPAARRARGAVGVRRRGEQDGRRRAAVDAQQGGAGGRRRGRRRGCAACSATSSRRAGSSASPSRRSCRRSRRASSSSSATPTATRRTATAARRSSSGSPGARDAGPGRVTDTPVPLFPRVDVEAVETPAA